MPSQVAFSQGSLVPLIDVAHLGSLLNALSSVDSPIWPVGTEFSAPCELWGPFYSQFLGHSLSSWLEFHSIHVYLNIQQRLMDSVHFCVALSLPELSPATFSFLRLPHLQCPSFQLRDTFVPCLEFPSLRSLECASRQSQGNYKAYLFVALPLGIVVLCSLVYNVWKQLFHIFYTSFLIV